MKVELDEEYINIVKDILSNKEFLKLKECIHHGLNRYDHSIRVSYQSYKYAKKHNLNYQEITRGALLHDFFTHDDTRTKTNQIISAFIHPKQALKNANELFELTEVQQDIIKSHMFPINYKIPKYKESWIVNALDKKITIIEIIYILLEKIQSTNGILILLMFMVNL